MRTDGARSAASRFSLARNSSLYLRDQGTFLVVGETSLFF